MCEYIKISKEVAESISKTFSTEIPKLLSDKDEYMLQEKLNNDSVDFILSTVERLPKYE